MSFIKKFLRMKGGKGIDCKPQEDGTERCVIYEKDGNQLLATGSSFGIATDPQSCEPFLVGENRINDEDIDEVNRALKSKSTACKKGIA